MRDLEEVPSEEYYLWLAFYDLENKEAKRAQRRAEIEAKLRSKAN